jgi:tetratricopeptide (TPR) repeat protein
MNWMKNKFHGQWMYGFLLATIISGIFLSPASIKAQSSVTSPNPAALFYQANGYYQRREYQQAAEVYHQLIQTGYESGNLYFNLGNTEYKLGHKGEAVLYYEKAKQLMPHDADLQSNLELALDGVDEGNPSWQRIFYQSIVSTGSLENLLVLTSVLFFILMSFLILILMVPMDFREHNNGKLKGWCLGTLVGIATVFLLSLSLTAATGFDHTRQNAVAVQASGEVRFEPNSQSTAYYRLAEGSRVQILEKKDNWLLIQRKDGKMGWIEAKFIAPI